MIYVEGMPPSVTIEEVAEHFGSIGVVKFDKKKNQKKVHHLRALLTQYGGLQQVEHVLRLTLLRQARLRCCFEGPS